MTDQRGAESGPMAWLAAGIPLSLIIDLALDTGPDSRAILEAERRPDGSQCVGWTFADLDRRC